MSTVFQSIELKDLVTYKSATLPLDRYPIMLIRGINKDRRSKNSSNAAGKSLIVSAIPTLRYGAPPTVSAKRSASIMHSKGSEIHLNVKNNKHKYRLSQFQKGRSVAYDVMEDGKALKYRESREAAAKIESLVPISEAQFYSFVYLDARRSHPLHIGTAAQRFEFFEQVFNLDVYDKIAKRINKDYLELKFQIQQLHEAETEYSQRSSTLPKQAINELKLKRADLISRAEKVRNKVNRHLKELRSVTIYMTLARGINFNISESELKKMLKEAKSDEIMLEKRYKDSIEHWSAVDKNKKIADKYAELKETIKQLKTDIETTLTKYPFIQDFNDNLEDIDAAMQESLTKTFALDAKYKNAQEANNLRDDYEKSEKDFKVLERKKEKYKKIKLEGAKAIIAKCNQRVDTLEKATRHLTSHNDDSSCPTCLRTLDEKSKKALISGFYKELNELKTKIDTWNRISRYLAVVEKLEELPKRQDTDAIKAEIEEERRTHTILRFYLRRSNTLKEAQEQLLRMPKFKVSEEKIGKPEVYKGTLDDLRQRIQGYEATLEKLAKIKELGLAYDSYEEAKVRYEQLQAYIDKYQPLLDRAQEALQSMTIKLTRAESVNKELEVLSSKIKKHKDATADYSVYEALREAYGAKGLRKMRTVMMAASLEQNLNKYASLLFAEPIKFTILVSKSQFSILAERNGKPAADVKTLSGSEGRCFVLLSLLSMLEFVPANARTNLLILDEMESLLDPPSRHLLINEFLPILNTIIPNIIIVTSHSRSEFNVPNAVGYSVVKSNGVSKLVADAA